MPFCPNCRSEFEASVAVCPDCDLALTDEHPAETPPPSVTEVAVTVFQSDLEAQMWAGVLRDEGIPSVIVALGPGAGAWGTTAFLPHELRVRSQDAERARELLP